MANEEVTQFLEDQVMAGLAEGTEDAIAELQDDGLSKEEAIDIVFNVLDTILAFKEIGSLIGSAAGGPTGGVIGGTIGSGAEAMSDVVLNRAKIKVQEFHRDADAIEARAQVAEDRGRAIKADRLRKAAKRVRARQAE